MCEQAALPARVGQDLQLPGILVAQLPVLPGSVGVSGNFRCKLVQPLLRAGLLDAGVLVDAGVRVGLDGTGPIVSGLGHDDDGWQVSRSCGQRNQSRLIPNNTTPLQPAQIRHGHGPLAFRQVSSAQIDGHHVIQQRIRPIEFLEPRFDAKFKAAARVRGGRRSAVRDGSDGPSRPRHRSGCGHGSANSSRAAEPGLRHRRPRRGGAGFPARRGLARRRSLAAPREAAGLRQDLQLLVTPVRKVGRGIEPADAANHLDRAGSRLDQRLDVAGA